jgi:hypothetical protein
MPWTFNPFSGTFDQKGSGGGGGASYIDGEVATYADLPLDGSAALNSAWLVRTASGVWPVSRKQAGIYIRTATGGSNRDSDYTYAGTMPDVFSDSQFLLYDNTDTSKNLAFDLGSITTGTVRTLTAPNASGRIQVEGQPIGNTTAAAGTFTTLSANNGTLTASAPVLDLAQTWNNAAVVFNAVNIGVTQTAANNSSSAINYVYNGSSIFRVTRTGAVHSAGGVSLAPGGNAAVISATLGTIGFTGANNAGGVLFANGNGGGLSVRVGYDGENTLGQRNDTNPQTFNIYNTYSSSTNHERLRLAWASNVAIIGTEKGSGGGTARALEFQTDGVTRLIVSTTGLIQIGGASSAHVALKRNSNTLQIRTADDLGFGGLLCGALTLHGNLDASTRNIVTDTTTGTKIGTGTTQKVGFFNATPVVQQAAVADATDAASTQDRLNDLLARLRTLGLIAT